MNVTTLASHTEATRFWNSASSVFAADVISGLSSDAKHLPSKYLYDTEGSRLFEAICKLPEYYPTRAETALLREIAGELAEDIADGALLVEFGSGASLKTRLLLDAAPRIAAYLPIDISKSALDDAVEALARDYPRLPVIPLRGDFTAPMRLPKSVAALPKVGFFPGSTVGNFTPGQASAFLENARQLLGAGARLIIGADLIKSETVLIPAYDDAQGVTAAFNLNLLTRINSELDGDADLSGFSHRAIWRRDLDRIEMHLVSLRSQVIRAAGRRFELQAGETIHTENSHKFSRESLAAIAMRAGWRMQAFWSSPAPEFGIALLEDAQ